MYDSIVIGNGPAGVTSAIYVKRSGMNVLVIGKDNGALEKARKIENYYGFPNGIEGTSLVKLGNEQLRELNIDFKVEEVVAINYKSDFFEVTTNMNTYSSKTVIIATGVNRKVASIDGIKKFEGKGVSYCAICDGFFFRNKDVAILGNGNYAISEAEELLPIVNSVTILTNGNEKFNLRDDRIKVIDNHITRLSGNDTLEKIEFEDDTKLDIAALFVAEGTASSIDFARRIGAATEGNNIVVNSNFMTNVPGLFAAGDCIGGLLQISKAVSDGAKAGLSVINYIRK